jgi:hypothetical protein
MISQQQPLGSLDQTHETLDVANVWQQQHIAEGGQLVVGFSNGNENMPGSQALFEQHAIDSQQYVDNSLTKRKTPFGKKSL